MKPRVLMISGDVSTLAVESAPSHRLALFGVQCERIDVLVCTRTAAGERHTGNVHVYGVTLNNFFWGAYRAILRGETLPRPTIVTTQDPFLLGLIGLFLSRYHRVPLQVQIHTDLFSREFVNLSIGNYLRTLVARVVIPRAGHVRVVSERIRETLDVRGLVRHSRITVLPIQLTFPPTSLKDRQAPTMESLRILTVSRLTPEKDLSLALCSFARVLKRYPKATMTIVGGGPLRDDLEQQAKDLDIYSSVTFTGPQMNVAPYYQDANVYLSTSRYEGFGLSLVEAALSGLPIVSTDVGVAARLNPSAIVPWDAEKIASALTSPLQEPYVPKDFLMSTEEFTRRIVEDWQTLGSVPVSTPKQKYVRFVTFLTKYVISGGTATAVNLSLLFCLTDLLGIWYVYSAAFAYAAAFVVSFTLQKFWTFKNGTLSHIKSQFVLYVALGTFNMFLNSYLIYLVVESIGLHYLAAQLCVGVFLALWSLMFYRILFKNQ